jgi:hypothetical protein
MPDPIRTSSSARTSAPSVHRRTRWRQRLTRADGGLSGRTDRGCAIQVGRPRYSSGRRSSDPDHSCCGVRKRTACQRRSHQSAKHLWGRLKILGFSNFRDDCQQFLIETGTDASQEMPIGAVRTVAVRLRPPDLASFLESDGERSNRVGGPPPPASLASARQLSQEQRLACLAEARRSRAKAGWEAGIRTPITCPKKRRGKKGRATRSDTSAIRRAGFQPRRWAAGGAARDVSRAVLRAIRIGRSTTIDRADPERHRLRSRGQPGPPYDRDALALDLPARPVSLEAG